MKKTILSSIVLAAVLIGCGGGDSACCDTGNKVEVKSDNIAPIATITNFTDGQTVTVGQNLTLTGDTSPDRDGTVTGYEWKVDGEVVSTEANPTITITTPGTHEITLTVTDNDGQNSLNTERRTVIVTGEQTTGEQTTVAPTAVIDLSDSNGPLLANSLHTFSCANSHDNDTIGTGAEIVSCQWNIQSYRIIDGVEVAYRSCSDEVMDNKAILICPPATRIVAELTVIDNDGQRHSTTKEYTQFR